MVPNGYLVANGIPELVWAATGCAGDIEKVGEVLMWLWVRLVVVCKFGVW